jgi:hypothetical protein
MKTRIPLNKINWVRLGARMWLPLFAFIPLSIFGQATPAPTPLTTYSISEYAEVMAAAQPDVEYKAAQKAKTTDTVPLSWVISQVQKALVQYNNSLGTGKDALPPLDSAEFDFKVTTAVVEGAKINFWIFSIGGSHEKDAVNDVTYTYSVPKATSSELRAEMNKPSKSPTLAEELVATIQRAAVAVKTAPTLGKLKFSKFTANIQYGVKWDASGGINVPVVATLVAGVNADVNKNSVQSVKLVFGK